MNRICFLAVAFSFAASQSLSAQGVSAQCPPGSFKSSGNPDNPKIAQDACQKAIDLFQYIAPELGAVLAGGNATQGMTGTLGGIGHFVLGGRGNGIRGSLPLIDHVVPAVRGAQQSTYETEKVLLGFPTGDLAVGIFKGFPLGLTSVGGLDLLASAAYLPKYSNESVDIAVPGGSWEIGYGAKIGILQESPLVPGVSVSYLERSLPAVSLTGKAGEDRLLLDSLHLETRSWRLVAGKSVWFLGVAAGYGQDTYDTDATLKVTIAPRPASEGGTGGPVLLTQKLTRTNMFASLWINAHVLRIVGEIGQVTGGDITTYNRFSGAQPADTRFYGSVGVNVGW